MRPPVGRSVIAVTKEYHGLGNRARVVFGAQSLARSNDRNIYAVWPVTRAFGARLDQLWETDIPTIPRWFSQSLRIRFPYRDETLTWMTDATSERIWQIRTAHALRLPSGTDSWQDELHLTRPVAPIAQRIVDFHAQHLVGHPWVGVMVRAHPHSHAETLRASPVDWYVDRMKQMQDTYPDLRFYVSADVPQVQQEVIDAVRGSIGLNDKGDYNSVAGLSAAVVDLYLLAGSVHLLGPHFSSFPELATHLAGVESLALETSRTPDDRAFDPRHASIAPNPLRPHDRVGITL